MHHSTHTPAIKDDESSVLNCFLDSMDAGCCTIHNHIPDKVVQLQLELCCLNWRGGGDWGWASIREAVGLTCGILCMIKQWCVHCVLQAIVLVCILASGVGACLGLVVCILASRHKDVSPHD